MASDERAPLDRTKLLAARFRAATERPYFASALFSITIVESHAIETMGVDRRWHCYVSPAFVERTSVEQLAAVWIHEMSHLVRHHHERADHLPDKIRLDRLRVNLAQDAEINDDITADGMTLPDPILPATFELEPGKVFEEYVQHIPAQARFLCNCGSGAHGVAQPWETASGVGISAAEAEAIRRHVAEAVKAAGKVPAGWVRWAEQFMEPTVDWRTVLAGAVREAVAWATGATDYTYQRPSRRGTAVPTVVLPSLQRPVPRVAVVIDTSGSMGEEELAAALTETSGVLQAVGLRREQITVLSCDAAVQVAKKVTAVHDIELVGGGGTDMRAGITAALDAPLPPQVVIVLTDGFTSWPEQEVRARVLAGIIAGQSGSAVLPPDPPTWIERIDINSG